MKKPVLLVTILCFGLTQGHAQDVLTKFKSEVCDCFQKIKLESMTTSTALEKEISACFTVSAIAHQKELKKRKVIDFDAATEEEVMNLWRQIFEQCEESKAAFERMEFLENEAAAQSFSGTITYVQDIKLSGAFEKMGLTKKMMIEEMNKEGKWFDTLKVTYWKGNYAKIGNNANVTTKIYDETENIIYSFSAKNDDVCSVQEAVDLDFSGNPDKPTVLEIDSVATIMGLPCKIIRMKWKISQVDYYYNTTLAQTSPDLFSKHSSEGFSEFIAMKKCLPMQIVTTLMGMDIIQTAVEVKSGKVDTSVFIIPELVEDESLNVMQLPGITIMRIKR